MVPAWPASSQASKADSWSGGSAGPTATRSNPSARPLSLTRAAIPTGVMGRSGRHAPRQHDQSALGERPPSLADESLPGGPPPVPLPLGAELGDRGQGVRLRREARDLLLHLEALHT